MRTASFTIDKALGMGLRTREGGRNSGRLFQLLNGRPMVSDDKAWLEPLQSVDDPFASAHPMSWPFPQLLHGRKYTFLCKESQIYTVNTSTWEATIKNLYNIDSDSTTDSVSGSGIWHLADGFDTYMLFNGVDMVYRDGRYKLGTQGTEDRVRVQDNVTIGTGCYHRGRFVLAGFDSDDFWSRWNSPYISDLKVMLPNSINITPQIDENVVWWSSIGGGDALFLVYPSYYNTSDILADAGGGYDSVDKFLYDILKRNELGWMPMPWQGRVRCVRPLGKAVMVYGDEGISALIPLNVDGIAPTYGLHEFSELGGVGIAGRGAISGDNTDHVCVDKFGYLWHINSQLQASRLGYREFFKGMEGSEISVTHDSAEGEFYIGDGGSQYILGKHGLYQTDQIVSAVNRIAGELKGVAVESGREDLIVGLDAFDMMAPGLKTIQEVVVGTDLTGFNTSVRVAVDFKYTPQEEWRRSDWFQCNPDGVCFPQISANQFRLIVQISPYTSTNVDYITVWYQLNDRRFVRGFSANISNTANA